MTFLQNKTIAGKIMKIERTSVESGFYNKYIKMEN